MFRLKVWRNRIGTLRKDILIPAIFFILSIILIELVLKYIPANTNLHFDLGQIYLKICYSFSSAAIFYFIVVHLPKERKKVKSFRYLNNKSFLIDLEIRLLVININKLSGSEFNTKKFIDSNDFNLALKKINPQNSFINSLESNITFTNWFDYLNYKGKKIKTYIHEILFLNDVIDADYLQSLTFIDDEISTFLNFDRKKWPNTDLSMWSHPICNILNFNKEMLEIMKKKYLRYQIEYQTEFIKKRKSKLEDI